MTIIIEHPNLNKYKKRECNHKWKVFMANDFVAMKCEICGNVPSKTETIDNLLGYIKDFLDGVEKQELSVGKYSLSRVVSKHYLF